MPAELADGPRISRWCPADQLAALDVMPPGHPQRAHVVFQVQHAAWHAYRLALFAWLRENGYQLHLLRKQGLLPFQPPYFD